jgi:hypothetical protein
MEMILADFRQRIRSVSLLSGLDPGNILLVVAVDLHIVFFVFAFCI